MDWGFLPRPSRRWAFNWHRHWLLAGVRNIHDCLIYCFWQHNVKTPICQHRLNKTPITDPSIMGRHRTSVIWTNHGKAPNKCLGLFHPCAIVVTSASIFLLLIHNSFHQKACVTDLKDQVVCLFLQCQRIFLPLQISHPLSAFLLRIGLDILTILTVLPLNWSRHSLVHSLT